MPLRDFVCKKCGSKQERYTNDHDKVKCIDKSCKGTLKVLERSNEGPGHTAHIRIK